MKKKYTWTHFRAKTAVETSQEIGGSIGAITGLATPIGSGSVRSSGAGGAPGGKKLFILAGPWDLEIPTNVILYERQPTMLPHPSPEVELVRYAFVMKLRQSYQVKQDRRYSDPKARNG